MTAIASLLQPRSIAIIGGSEEAGSAGRAALENLKRFKYGGDVHLVSRTRQEMPGLNWVSDIDELPRGIDLALLAVPSTRTPDALEKCGARGTRAAIAFAAGFAEVGGEGAQLQDRVARVARDHDIALLGPNCIGLVNFVQGIPLTFEPNFPQTTSMSRRIGVITQSGAMSSILRLALHAKRLAFSYVISTGNEAALGAEDLLQFLVEDPETHVIALFAEQFRDPHRLLQLARQAKDNNKPIVLMHPGRSVRARESAQSHTGAMASNHEVMATLVQSEGVLLVPTIEELIDTAEMLVRYTTLPVKGPAIITNSGAFKGFALDFSETIGLDLPEASAATKDRLAKELPPFATAENPLDFTAYYFRDPTLAPRVATQCLESDEFGSLMAAIVLGPPQMTRTEALVAALSRSAKPSVVAIFGDESPLEPQISSYFRDNGICFFRSPERALRALANITRYASDQQVRQKSSQPPLPLACPRTGIIPEYLSKELLRSVSIPVPEGRLVKTMAEAQEVASQIGYPVVIKAQSAALAHKTDSGAVMLNIATPEALKAAWVQIEEAVGRHHPDVALDGMLVERMADRGIEMVVGAKRDKDWGPVVLVGLGGIWVETLNDTVLVPPDLTTEQIYKRICQLRSAPLLFGARGTQPVDVMAVAGLVETVGNIMRSNPWIAELDINPLSVTPHGVLALDVLIRTSADETSSAQ